MENADLIAILRDANFSPYQADVYLALLDLGSASAREIAEASGVPTPRIYDILRDLEDGRYVVTYEQDRLYAHIPNVSDSLAGIRSRIDRYESAIEAIEARWTEPETIDQEVTLLRRFDTVFEKVRQDIENADHYVQLSLSPDDFQSLKPTLSRAYDRDVRIFVLIQTPPDGDLAFSTEDFDGVCTEARGTIPCHSKPFAALIDHQKAGFAINRNSSNEYGLHVSDPAHEYIFWFYLAGLWEVGTPVFSADELHLPITLSEVRASIQMIEPVLKPDTDIHVHIEGAWTRTGRSCAFSGVIRDVDYTGDVEPGEPASVLQLADQATLVVEVGDDVYSVGGYGAVLEDVAASRITIEDIIEDEKAECS